MDVAEVPKPGQLLELKEASDDELVEVTENIIEVLEHCEFEEEDEDPEESDQEELEVCGDYVHRPDAPWEDQYTCRSKRRAQGRTQQLPSTIYFEPYDERSFVNR